MSSSNFFLSLIMLLRRTENDINFAHIINPGEDPKVSLIFATYVFNSSLTSGLVEVNEKTFVSTKTWSVDNNLFEHLTGSIWECSHPTHWNRHSRKCIEFFTFSCCQVFYSTNPPHVLSSPDDFSLNILYYRKSCHEWIWWPASSVLLVCECCFFLVLARGHSNFP